MVNGLFNGPRKLVIRKHFRRLKKGRQWVFDRLGVIKSPIKVSATIFKIWPNVISTDRFYWIPIICEKNSQADGHINQFHSSIYCSCVIFVSLKSDKFYICAFNNVSNMVITDFMNCLYCKVRNIPNHKILIKGQIFSRVIFIWWVSLLNERDVENVRARQTMQTDK